jgi:hypothetical protein
MQRTGCSANMLRRLSNGRNSAALNWTELQHGHLWRIKGSRGAQAGQIELVSLILRVPFHDVVGLLTNACLSLT